MKFFMLWAGLSAGNFIYQIITAGNEWDTAVERSVFQGVAIALTWFVCFR